jgi:hypothetical protein
MTAVKTTTVTFRIKPDIKDALRLTAEQEHRSLANRLEVMIRDWCEREGFIPLARQRAPVERHS